MATKIDTSPLLSVVMPVYNGEKYLAEAIESVLAQTYTHFEFIIVNDGSQDTTSAIIERYKKKDARIQAVHLARNGGISDALNAGIKLAKGDYIVRADCDDIILSHRFATQVAYFATHRENVDVLGSAFCLFFDTSPDTCKPVPAYAHDVYNAKSPVHHPTCMIKRELFQKYGTYNTRFNNAEDVEMWFRWFSQGVRFANLEEVLYKKRIHEGSVSISRIKQQVYLLFKINMISLINYRIPFTRKGYLHIAEQFFYLIYLTLRLDRLYAKDKTVNRIKRKAN